MDYEQQELQASLQPNSITFNTNLVFTTATSSLLQLQLLSIDGRVLKQFSIPTNALSTFVLNTL
ncbi:MAG: hypothetical protein ACRBFS_14945 [Aureispira sp.]